MGPLQSFGACELVAWPTMRGEPRFVSEIMETAVFSLPILRTSMVDILKK